MGKGDPEVRDEWSRQVSAQTAGLKVAEKILESTGAGTQRLDGSKQVRTVLSQEQVGVWSKRTKSQN